MMKETGYPFRGWLSSCSLHEVNFYSSLLTPWNAKSIMTFWVMFRVQSYSDKEILSAKCFSPSQVSPSLSKISLQVSFHNKIILHSNRELHALPHSSCGESLLFHRWAGFANGHFIAKCAVPLGEKIISSPAHASSPSLLISGVIMLARVICTPFKWYANVLFFFFSGRREKKLKAKSYILGEGLWGESLQPSRYLSSKCRVSRNTLPAPSLGVFQKQVWLLNQIGVESERSSSVLMLLVSCQTEGKLLEDSEPLFSHLCKGNSDALCS